jgi:hypothetical protein
MKNHFMNKIILGFYLLAWCVGWLALEINVPELEISVEERVEHDLHSFCATGIGNRVLLQDEKTFYCTPKLFGVVIWNVVVKEDFILGILNTRTNRIVNCTWSSLGQGALDERHQELWSFYDLFCQEEGRDELGQ